MDVGPYQNPRTNQSVVTNVQGDAEILSHGSLVRNLGNRLFGNRIPELNNFPPKQLKDTPIYTPRKRQ